MQNDFNILVKYNSIDLDESSILFKALQKDNEFDNNSNVFLDKFSYKHGIENCEVELILINTKKDEDIIKVIYNELYDENIVYKYVTECIEDMTYYNFSNNNKIDRVDIDIISIEKI